MLQPPGSPSLGKGGHARSIDSGVSATGQAIGQRIERSGARPLSLDKGQDLTEILWCEGAPMLLRVDPIELRCPAKRFWVRPDARNPDRDTRLLHRGRPKLHLRELIVLALVADLPP